jgi:hypothetical protein
VYSNSTIDKADFCPGELPCISCRIYPSVLLLERDTPWARVFAFCAGGLIAASRDFRLSCPLGGTVHWACLTRALASWTCSIGPTHQLQSGEKTELKSESLFCLPSSPPCPRLLQVRQVHTTSCLYPPHVARGNGGRDIRYLEQGFFFKNPTKKFQQMFPPI